MVGKNQNSIKENNLILIGGVAGSGKTFIGKQIAKELSNCIYIDKDTISRYFADEMLCLLGSTKHDRESDIYLTKIRNLEYDTMMQQAFENLQLGKNVICSAPFLRELGDSGWIGEIDLKARLSGGRLIKIWIRTDQQTAKERLIQRGTDRDIGKLGNWPQYVSSVEFSPPKGLIDFHEIDNSHRAINTLRQQLNNLYSSL